jgi:hypothetical protein
MWEAVSQSQRLSITLRNLDTENNLADMKFITVTSQSIGIIVEVTSLVPGRQTVPERIERSTVHRLFSIHCAIYCDTTYRAIYSFHTHYIVQPFNIIYGAPLACGNMHCTEPLNTANQNYVKRHGSYSAVCTLCIGYKNWSVNAV